MISSMKRVLSSLAVFVIIMAGFAHSATVGVDSGGANPLLFERSNSSALEGGTLFVGAFDGDPNGVTDIAVLLSQFRPFGSDVAVSGSFGNFPNSQFTGNVVPTGGSFDFRGQQIYVLVIDSDSIAGATELAFFTADSFANWTFPTIDDGGINPNADDSTNIVLNQQNNRFAGNNDSLDPDGPGDFGTFDSIQLIPIPEPVPLVLPLACFVVFDGRPGIEFEFPTAQAGNFTFVLEESEGGTLLEDSWIDVAASPTVVSDDGTTQVIQIIHPASLTSAPRRFFRLVGS